MKRVLLIVALVVGVIWLVAARGKMGSDGVDAGLVRATGFLLRSQQADGSFRSETYGLMKDAVAITPHVLYTLQEVSQTAEVGVGGWGAEGVAGGDTAFEKGLRFLRKCQNVPATVARKDPFRDGGFFFSPSEVTRNKAAELGMDAAGVVHYRSYGTMTADGLR